MSCYSPQSRSSRKVSPFFNRLSPSRAGWVWVISAIRGRAAGTRQCFENMSRAKRSQVLPLLACGWRALPTTEGQVRQAEP